MRYATREGVSKTVLQSSAEKPQNTKLLHIESVLTRKKLFRAISILIRRGGQSNQDPFTKGLVTTAKFDLIHMTRRMHANVQLLSLQQAFFVRFRKT